MSPFYDTHAHLDFPDFASDLGEVIQRAAGAGIERIISIGTDLESSRRAIALAERFPAVYAVVGWHPSHATEAPADFRGPLRELAAHRKVVAIGETGLDYHRLPDGQEPGPGPEEVKNRQAGLFRQHLEVAAELGLNCVIHQRDSMQDVLNQMRPHAGKVRGVFHCFADDRAAQQTIQAMGSMVSFTGILTFKNAGNVRETLAGTPLGEFMLETDCPYLAPVPYRGKRCEPAYVREIAEVAAATKGCTLEELSEASCVAARKFFRQFS